MYKGLSLNFLALLILLAPVGVCFSGSTSDYSQGEAYERIVRLGNIVLNANAERLYAVYKEPDQPQKLIRLHLDNGKIDTLISPLSGDVGRLFLGPDENRLIFTADSVGDERHKLHILDLPSKKQIVVTPDRMLDLPCGFSSDGKSIYAARGTQLWSERSIVRIASDSGASQIVAHKPGAYLLCSGVSADNRQLLIKNFISNDEQHLGILDLAKVAETTNQKETLLDKNNIQWLIKEPETRVTRAMFDNQSVYFLSDRKTDKTALWKYQKESGIQPVTLPISAELKSFYLSNTGNLLLQYRGALKTRVILLRQAKNGVWQPVNTGADPEKTTAIIISENNHNRFLLMTEDGRPPVLSISENGKIRELLNSDRSGLPASAFAHFQSHLIESFDGTRIPTHILVPSFASVQNPLPMLVWVHGGPQEYIDPDYSAAFQRLANAGFVLVIPNVRGSAGFGKKFKHMDNGDWGGGHIRDLIAVSEYASKLDFVARRPRFIMGGSFGGFSVMSAISQFPDAFDGAIDVFGVVDIESFIAGLPDTVKRFFIKELGFDPVLNPQRSETISPLYQAHKIRIPVQIHQGIKDARVLVDQSRKMVETLKKNKVPVEYFEYNEGHGFTQKDNDVVARRRMIDFLLRLRESFHQGPRQIYNKSPYQ